MDNCKIHGMPYIHGYCVHCVRNEVSYLSDRINVALQLKNDLYDPVINESDNPIVESINAKINEWRDKREKLEKDSGLS